MKLHLVMLLSALVAAPGTVALADASNMQVFTSSGSFTVPSGVTRIEVEVRGGGGGGGGGGISSGRDRVFGASGGGGGYGMGVFTVSAGTVFSVTVGAGGRGSETNGTAGGTSSFGTLISATGGGGGGSSTGAVGGTSTAPLNMRGFKGHFSGSYNTVNEGGACGDGSSRGSGGTGGGAGAAGNVVVRW